MHHEPGLDDWMRAAADQVALVVGAVSDVLPLPLHADRAAVIDTGTGQMWPLTGVP